MNDQYESAVAAFCLMRPRPGMEQALQDALVGLLPSTRAETGCLAYNLYLKTDGCIVLHEVWRTQADFDAHVQRPQVSKFFGHRLEEFIIGTMDVHQARPLST